MDWRERGGGADRELDWLERERDRERQRETERDRERQAESERQTDRQIETETDGLAREREREGHVLIFNAHSKSSCITSHRSHSYLTTKETDRERERYT